jgi:uncharacterized protein (DUF736 family)
MSNDSTEKNNDWKNREIGALWKKASANGKGSYCTGYIISDELGNKIKQRVVMFSNKSKNNEKAPDFIIYITNEQENNSAPSAPKQTQKAYSNAKPKPQPKPQESSSYDDDDGVPM